MLLSNLRYLLAIRIILFSILRAITFLFLIKLILTKYEMACNLFRRTKVKYPLPRVEENPIYEVCFAESTKCEPHEYDCEDATCIDASLQCNGIRNCRHESDEEGCGVS